MRTYKLRILDGSGVTETIEAKDLANAEKKAREWVLAGSWDKTETFWVDVEIERDGATSLIAVTIDPPLPACSEGHQHTWKEKGVFGNGGGVIIRDLCPRCGLTRVTNTWASRQDTGEQGLESVQYVREES